MRAVVDERYGPPHVLSVADIPAPEPKHDELLVRVRATTVNRTDCGFRQPRPFFVRLFSGLRRPRRPVLGTEFAGEVEAVGPDVSQFAVGDRVFGVNADRFGAHAELLCVPEAAPVATMPADIDFDEAAAICDGAILALTCLQRGNIELRPKTLIYAAIPRGAGDLVPAGREVISRRGPLPKALREARRLGAVACGAPHERVSPSEQPWLTASTPIPGLQRPLDLRS